MRVATPGLLLIASIFAPAAEGTVLTFTGTLSYSIETWEYVEISPGHDYVRDEPIPGQVWTDTHSTQTGTVDNVVLTLTVDDTWFADEYGQATSDALGEYITWEAIFDSFNLTVPGLGLPGVWLFPGWDSMPNHGTRTDSHFFSGVHAQTWQVSFGDSIGLDDFGANYWYTENETLSFGGGGTVDTMGSNGFGFGLLAEHTIYSEGLYDWSTDQSYMASTGQRTTYSLVATLTDGASLPAVVPEPGTWFLTGASVLMLLGRRTRSGRR